MWQKIKELREQRGQALTDMKAILNKAEGEKRELTAEESGKFDELNTQAEARKADIDRYERAKALEGELGNKPTEQRAGREDVNTAEQKADQQSKEQRAQFDAYLRTGVVPAGETRTVTVSGSGVVGPRQIYDQLIVSLKTFGGVREAGATIIPTSDGNDLTVPKVDDTSNTGQIVGEAVQDDTAADPSLGSITLKAYMFDSKWIKVSLEMLQDAAYPIEQFILNAAGERIGRSLNAYATTGTGSGQPTGFLTAATLGKTAASATGIAYEELLDLIHSIDAGYRNAPNFGLTFHDTTLAALRKLKDGSGRYIFDPGTAGVPGRVLNYEYTVNNDMPQLSSGAGSKVIAAGDFGRYFIRDVTGVTIIRATELFAAAGLVGFRVFSRHDANLTDANAIKYLKLAAS